MPGDLLAVVGAGTGTDVAIALSEGAQHVDVVEIDPTGLRPPGALRDPVNSFKRG